MTTGTGRDAAVDRESDDEIDEYRPAAETVLTTLLDENVLETVDDGNMVVLTDRFETAIDEHRRRLAAFNDVDEIDVERVDDGEDRTTTCDDTLAASLARLWETEPALLAVYRALTAFLDDSSPEDRLSMVPVLAQFGPTPPRIEGAPVSFTPVYGEYLPPFLSCYRRAIVYVWRDDCPPCDTMRAELDTVFRAQPIDIGLFAVYGPTAADSLHEEYDVNGGPTTLFVIDGRVDARLHGAHHPETIESEIETLRKLTPL